MRETNSILPASFYTKHATLVARELLGARLVRRLPDGALISGIIVETEAYTGLDDLASHGRPKRTPRNLPMWGEPGHAYVYLSRGVHWMLNVVAEPDGHPAAVLIRAIDPLEGQPIIALHRPGRNPREWTSGPGRLAVALNVTQAQNRVDMTTPKAGLWITAGVHLPDERVRTGPRIGLGKRVAEPWFSMPWRYYVAGNPFVSK